MDSPIFNIISIISKGMPRKSCMPSTFSVSLFSACFIRLSWNLWDDEGDDATAFSWVGFEA